MDYGYKITYKALNGQIVSHVYNTFEEAAAMAKFVVDTGRPVTLEEN